VSEWLLFNGHFSAISLREQVIFWWDDDDDFRFVLDKHAALKFYSASSLKQYACRHAAPLGHIILIQGQSVFGLTP
jgi:hypothetical protein